VARDTYFLGEYSSRQIVTYGIDLVGYMFIFFYMDVEGYSKH
jgi:hypothetical protein